MTGDHAPVRTVSSAVALPTPRRPPLEPAAGPVEPASGAPRPGPVLLLSRRDLDLLACLARGRSTAQIAAVLSVSSNTARTRIRRVQGKLDVADRAAAVRAARDLGVLVDRR
ncbi:LuxR C-terminal-related transcriptional regulator [Geodermatophilus sp. SYSU D00696]